jgi:hypothetical protein
MRASHENQNQGKILSSRMSVAPNAGFAGTILGEERGGRH